MSCSSLSSVASLLYPALAHSDLTFDGLAKAAMAFFQCCAGILARIALASLLASSCSRCRRCTASLPSWPLKVRLVQRWHLPALHWRFARILPASLPASCCHRRRGVVPASSPLVRERLCPQCAPLVVTFTFLPSLPYVVSSPYPIDYFPAQYYLPSKNHASK